MDSMVRNDYRYKDWERRSALAAQDPVKAALEYVQESEPDPARVATLTEEREALAAKREACMPIEGNLIERLEKEMLSIDKTIEAEKRTIEAHSQGLDYPTIDLSIPLSWRDRDRMPKLAVFSLDKGSLRFNFHRPKDWIGFIGLALGIITGFIIGSIVVVNPDITNWFILGAVAAGAAVFLPSLKLIDIVQKRDCRMDPQLPNVFAKHYSDLVDTLESLAKGGRFNETWSYSRVSRTTYFKGAIPDDVKADIKEARKHFGNNIYMVAEANGWTQDDKTAPPRRLDPLVIGVKGDNTWLITSFDLTPIEEAIKTEFTS